MNILYPSQYKPLKKQTICSNVIHGGGQLITLKDDFPVLVGSGPVPKIWLKGYTDSEHKTLSYVVEENKSNHSAVKVKTGNNSVSVLVGSTVILSAKATSPDVVIVDKVDLRPLGLNIYGDKSALNAGGASFSNNSMTGGHALVAFG
ncbi:hypothetical protein HJ171_08115 [Vibrio parahaemolyticus]|uniref:hypothetical protein n=1 Tax=Vibrio parahaemolyticus TaxID=670 RepID=UPI001120889C|nr:hypothetical protein [Vibrio parahaemolyticus]MBE3837202.1 hypothetical protein [Vibrio parahaemolyticus]TOA77172.1 hypothetical protein CGK19_21385 [Vibrio parahaemolyticus]TOF29615.1 hypothetical protein CGJ25_17250 [Vibrio parahaemolyticus]